MSDTMTELDDWREVVAIRIGQLKAMGFEQEAAEDLAVQEFLGDDDE